jgi:hypothetical protein
MYEILLKKIKKKKQSNIDNACCAPTTNTKMKVKVKNHSNFIFATKKLNFKIPYDYVIRV